MSKTKRLMIALVVVVLVVACAMFMREQNKDHGQKEVQITIKVDDQVIYEAKEKTDASTLGNLLKEMNDEGDIKVVTENGQYGTFITAMGVDEVFSQDMNAQKFWTYTSENNKTCVADGYCSSVDTLNIYDQDKFVFELSQIKY